MRLEPRRNENALAKTDLASLLLKIHKKPKTKYEKMDGSEIEWINK